MTTETPTLWREYDAPSGWVCHWRVGPLHVWVERDEREWRCASNMSDDPEDELSVAIDEESKPEDFEWGRWAYADRAKSIKLEPVLPDRPLVVRPLSPIQIPPEQTTRFFVSVPLWVRMSVIDKGTEVTLNDWPTITLSNSWFGTPVDGELCYALKTRARADLDEFEPKPWRAIFPLMIRNAHDEVLNFERLCLHGEYLNVYRGDSHLWTCEGEFVYRGPLLNSQVTFGKGAPPFDNASTVIGSARKEARRFASLSFDNLKSFALG